MATFLIRSYSVSRVSPSRVYFLVLSIVRTPLHCIIWRICNNSMMITEVNFYASFERALLRAAKRRALDPSTTIHHRTQLFEFMGF